MRDGSITFSTALDNAQLEKDLDRLGKKILRERELLGGLKIKKNGLEKQLKAAGAALDELQKKTKAAHGGAVISFGDVEKIALLKPAVSAIKGEIGKYTEAIRESNRELESAKSSWGEVYAQLEDIRRLYALDRVESLSAALKETIVLRETYPELTLNQLAEEFEPPITKSCLNHRLRKLVELSRA